MGKRRACGWGRSGKAERPPWRARHAYLDCAVDCGRPSGQQRHVRLVARIPGQLARVMLRLFLGGDLQESHDAQSPPKNVGPPNSNAHTAHKRQFTARSATSNMLPQRRALINPLRSSSSSSRRGRINTAVSTSIIILYNTFETYRELKCGVIKGSTALTASRPSRDACRDQSCSSPKHTTLPRPIT